VNWRRVRLDGNDFQTIRYMNHQTFIEFSEGTRLVSIGARNADAKPNIGDAAKVVAKAIEQGASYPELIAVQPARASLILVEGHTRATAYVLARSNDVEAIVGSSGEISRWEFY
jgi:hypothetical protein